MVNRPDTKAARQKRHKRVRGKVSGTADRPRLCVFRSLQNIYAQLIDDTKGVTLVSASTIDRLATLKKIEYFRHPSFGKLFLPENIEGYILRQTVPAKR